MAGRNGQVHLSTYVPVDVATAFQDWARRTDGGTSAALRRLIAQALDRANEATGLHGASPAQQRIAPRGVGRGQQIGFRLRPAERAVLDAAARQAAMSPANWVRSLVLVHLTKRPQWTNAELDALRDLFRALRGIAKTIDQIAHDLQAVAPTGPHRPDQGSSAHAAADVVRQEMRQVVAIMTGNFDYWGLPDAERPVAQSDIVGCAQARRKRRSRRFA